jgi:RNA polymerase sigma factor (sigma-70 family)
MATGQLSTFIRQLRFMVSTQETLTVTDAQLLERFIEDRDQVAFEVLMWRHGPMVLGVCRRLLAQIQDVEDAFQATFLALVRRGNTIGKRESVGSWLYKVAYRAALRIRTMARKRAAHERLTMDVPAKEPACEPVWHGLDEAIEQLPRKYRLPIVLCYFEGKTHEQAAEQLGWPKGTVAVRLLRARELLRARLIRRGLTLSAGVLGTALAQAAGSAAVPAALVTTTLKATTFSQTSKALAAGLLSRQAAAVMEGIVRTMYLTRLKTVASVVVAVAVLTAGAAVFAGRLFTTQPASAAYTEPPAGKQKPRERLDQDVQAAIARAVDYLKSAQQDGNWEHVWNRRITGFQGGLTSLALLALLDSDVRPNDEAITKGLAYLRGLSPQEIYVVALQTVVFCRADPQRDRALIQRNVNYLLDARSDEHGKFIGWSYTKRNSQIADNSNTQFAVMALYAASKAGIKIDEGIWREIQSYYLRTQQADGGWVYSPPFVSGSTLTMTCGGICGLAISRDRLKEKAEALDAALARGITFLGERFSLDPKFNQYYLLHGIARAGRLSGKDSFKGKQPNEEHDWYREGARILLANQQQSGAWKAAAGTIEENPIIATSFALLFLSKNK